MALVDNIPALLEPDTLKSPYLDDGIAAFTGTTEDTYLASGSTSLVSAKTAAKNAAHTAVNSAFTAVGNQKNTAVTNINALIDVISANHAGEVGLLAELAQLKIDAEDEVDAINEDPSDLNDAIDSAIDSNIADEVGGPILISEVLADAITKLNTAFWAYEADLGAGMVTVFAHPDNRCGESGRVTENGETKICPSCEGIGRTKTQNTPTIASWSVSDNIPL